MILSFREVGGDANLMLQALVLVGPFEVKVKGATPMEVAAITAPKTVAKAGPDPSNKLLNAMAVSCFALWGRLVIRCVVAFWDLVLEVGCFVS